MPQVAPYSIWHPYINASWLPAPYLAFPGYWKCLKNVSQ